MTLMSEDEVREYIGSVHWKFAKSYPDHPHEYTIRDWNPEREDAFERFVKHVRAEGQEEAFYSSSFFYFYFDGHKYWTMGAAVRETTVINRAEVPDEDAV